MNKKTIIVPSGKPGERHELRVEQLPPHLKTLIVSYPKCGRTWLRSIIGKYLQLKYDIPEDLMLETEQASVASGLPPTAFTHDGAAMLSRHDYLDLYYPRTAYQDRNVILLGRDLKDTLVSAYFQATKRMKVFEGPISEFIKTDQFGIRKLLAFYDVWKQNKQIPANYLYITYEEMHADPVTKLTSVLKIIGENEVDRELLEQSLEYNNFENQKAREAKASPTNTRTTAADVNDSESYKARKGKVGGYTDYLTPEDEDWIDNWTRQFEFKFEDLRR